jgi:uncharacterized membrane protein
VPIWILIAAVIASVAISFLLMPKVKAPKPPSLDDYDNPTAEAGRPVPVVFGTIMVKGLNVLWYGNKHIRTSKS